LVLGVVVLVARRIRSGAGSAPAPAAAEEPVRPEPVAPPAAAQAAPVPVDASAAAQNGNGHAPKPEAVEPADAVGTDARTVLVVDDEAFVRATTARILTLAGFDVLQASSAADAIAIGTAHDQQIHALLSDVVMPEMSGFELAEEARRIWPDTAVILFSAYTAAALERHKLRKSADMKVLMKPVEPAELIDAVTAAIDATQG
jgi:CheY-like chemotaxis protein